MNKNQRVYNVIRRIEVITYRRIIIITLKWEIERNNGRSSVPTNKSIIHVIVQSNLKNGSLIG